MNVTTGAIVGGVLLIVAGIGWAVFRPTERDHYVHRIPRDLDGRPTRGRR